MKRTLRVHASVDSGTYLAQGELMYVESLLPRTRSIAPLFALLGSLFLACCANPSTLQTAHRLSDGQAEHSFQGVGALNLAADELQTLPMAAPAYGFRKGSAEAEGGLRVTAPGNLQADFKVSTEAKYGALSAGFGVGTDALTLLVAAASDDDDDDDAFDDDDDDEFGALTFDAFIPVVATLDLVPEYLSVHATGRLHLMKLGPRWAISAISALGLRAGKDYGVHVEVAPVVTPGLGQWWLGAAQFFIRTGP